MGYAGKKCTATSRVIVASQVYDRFRDALTAAIEALQVVDPFDEKTLVGPVIDARARSAALDAVAGSGGRVLTGGAAPRGPGRFPPPAPVRPDEPPRPPGAGEGIRPGTGAFKGGTAGQARRTPHP